MKKTPLIYWEAPANEQQAMYGEKHPHFGLLLSTIDDTGIVLYYTHEIKLVITAISKQESHFTEIAKVDIPDEILENALMYIKAWKDLRKFGPQFLALVEKYRRPIDAADDILAEIHSAEMTPEQRYFAYLASGTKAQPFPRKRNTQEL